ncbi:timeless-domain-containing protein [Epithele typhae]|uniref:timeless-domain-containing protein n=1 Tax=Epithele typhae TaxID=378194 RepID=UPI0020077579|nr:timeless-domain-containing protein [Epithele typhae]KAH9924971.1 timeless-domain-containing protein [Epithele typhae]
MDRDEANSAVEDEESGDEPFVDRRAILGPPIKSVVDALGGFEQGVYSMGDECYGCLKDLKKYWRKDDTDDDRTVARIFWDTRVLPNDLVPILLQTAGKGLFEDKRGIACADLMTAMTWPIDLAEELKELDDEYDKGVDYTALLLSHLHYKAALLRPGVLDALFAIALPSLAKEGKERQERDVQIVNVILHLVRNLAFIKDLPSNMHASADHAELSTLQSRLIKGLSDSHFIELLMTIAANAADDPLFKQWNALTLEIFYLLYRGVKPASLASDQAKHSSKTLATLLAAEDVRKRNFARHANTRHSRFGTTLSVTVNPKKAKPPPQADEGVPPAPAQQPEASTSRPFVLHRQQALMKDVGSTLDRARAKKTRAPNKKKVDELGREDNLSVDSRLILQNLATEFIENAFNPLIASLLKDIAAERHKITEKDNLRLLYVNKWFLEFFLCERARQADDAKWKFGYVATVTESEWVNWVLKEMRNAQEDKPKLWNALQAGVECLTQFLMVLDAMTSTERKAGDDPFAFAEANKTEEDDIADTARILQQQIIYNGHILDRTVESLKSYKEGRQSLAYLDASVYLAYALFKMLEKWAKRKGEGDMYVRKKQPKKKGTLVAKTVPEGEGVPDFEEEEPQPKQQDMVHETMFTLKDYEKRFVDADITTTFLAYLIRYPEYASSEQMKRVVSLMHRQVVKQKAEGLYFMVSTLNLFKKIIAEEKSLPRDQPYKDLVALIKYLLRQFFKAVEKDSFVIVEAFYPKNRGHWKALSSREPEELMRRTDLREVDPRFPPDVYVKKGYSASEQIGIAMKVLTENGQMVLIEWTRQILLLCIGSRLKIIEDVDGSSSKTIDLSNLDSENDDDDIDAMLGRRKPSAEALAKIRDYLIPYVSDEEADAANKNPHLKLLFRLVNFKIMDQDADELEWFIPSVILPGQLQTNLNVINQYLETPLDLEGKKAEALLKKKRRPRRRKPRGPALSDESDDVDGLEDLDVRNPKKRVQRKKEKQQYKSAQFIEDSDEDEAELEAFYAREAALRARMSAQAASAEGAAGTTQKRATKKRRRKGKDGKDKTAKRRRKRGGVDAEEEAEEAGSGQEQEPQPKQVDGGSDSEESEFDVFGSPKRARSSPDTSSPVNEAAAKPKPRPRPRPRARISKVAAGSGDETVAVPIDGGGGSSSAVPSRATSQALLSDDDMAPSRGARGKGKPALLVLSDEE